VNERKFSTQCKWDPTRWNTSAGRANGTKEDTKTLNIYLDTLQARVYEAQRQLIADNEEITVNAIGQKLGGATGESRMLMEIFENHNNQLAQLVGGTSNPFFLYCRSSVSSLHKSVPIFLRIHFQAFPTLNSKYNSDKTATIINTIAGTTKINVSRASNFLLLSSILL
jgi:hypothetical protein